MRDLPDDSKRLALIRQMWDLLQEECPWIALFHLESYALIQGWMENVKPTGLSIPTVKYVDVNAPLRARLRAEWNRPVRWPLAVLAGIAGLVVLPAVRTYRRERR